MDSDGEFFSPGTSLGSFVDVLSDPAEDADWIRIQWQKTEAGLPLVGWMLKGHLDAPLGEPAVAPVEEGEFVRSCAREELFATLGDDPTHAILADYLVALAWLESDGLTQLGRRKPQVDAVGPYQFSANAWSEIAGAAGVSEADRFNARIQIIGAAAIARRDWAAFSKLSRPDGDTAPDGPFIPSFLNLFHAWLIGVPAAQEVDRTNAIGDPTTAIGPIIEKHHPGASNEVIAARADYLRNGGQDARVAGFIRTTTEKLNNALKLAGELLVKHAREFALPGGGTAAPWMNIAQRELQFWTTNGLTESSPGGKERVRSYFAATDHGVTDADPWCGAFIAYCLKESGNKHAAASIISGAAVAANWKRWGDIELHASVTDSQGGLRKGAVVVLSPAGDTGTSGHVTFFTGVKAGSDRIVCLGGNQSNRVKESDYPTSRIVAVRFLDVGDADALPDQPVSGAITDDVVRFRPMLDFIAAHEGTANQPGRGYDTSLGFGKFIGGEKILTAMTMEQIDALQTEMLDNPMNNFNSSALGRYQIVRTTLRRLKGRLQLPGSTLFSADLQDQLGVVLIKGRGRNVDGLRNEWASLKSVNENDILQAFDQVGTT